MTTTLSITDGAPRTVTLTCGAEARIPSAMDYRIVSAVSAAVEEADSIDSAVLLAYCCLHATRREVKKLWQAARKPQALYDDMVVWMAGMDTDALSAAINEISSYDSELSELAGSADDDGKKKTG